MTTPLMEQLVKALETARCIAAEALEDAQRAYAGRPSKWVAEQRDFDEIEAALSAYRQQAAEPEEMDISFKTDRRSDGMPKSTTERYLRRLLASQAALPGYYHDDGEAHDAEIDFMRDIPHEIDRKLTERNRRKLEASSKS